MRTLISLMLSFFISNQVIAIPKPTSLKSDKLKEIYLRQDPTKQSSTSDLNEKKIKAETKTVEETVMEGKGVWVNVWNYPTDVEAFMDRLDKFNMNTIYLQVNRSTTAIFKLQTGVDQILKAAHKRNIKVIGWTYCYLKDIETDVRKFVEPALYVSPDGERLDGMAADIEENTALWAVKSYTQKIKERIPADYPMIAIVFSPKIKSIYPWEYIAQNWDVLMPMTYWHGLKNRNEDTVYNFVKDSIINLRQLTKKDDLKIHLITDGDRTSSNEVKISMRAAKDLGVAGISIYPEHLATDAMLHEMSK